MPSQNVVLFAVVCSALAAGTARAQDGTPASDTPRQSSNANMEEIIVTARKRQESILDVPVVETVITQETLVQSKIDDLYTVATRTPGLVLGGSVSSVGTLVTVRGVGATANNSTADQSVSLNLDGLQVNQGNAYSAGMFDVAQVEVLKGPQALYFGKNNTAGVISLRSADPTDEREMITRVGYEQEAKEKEVELILSGPVSDSLKLRLAARFSDQDGYFTNKAVGIPELGGQTPRFDKTPTQDLNVRGTVLFEPSDRVSARLKLNYTDSSIDGTATPLQISYCPDGTGGVPPQNIPFLAGDDCKPNKDIYLTWLNPDAFDGLERNGQPFQDMSQAFGTLELNFGLSDSLSLTSVTGYYDLDWSAQTVGSAAAATTTSSAQVKFYDREFTEEVRLTSEFSGSPVNFMLGAFYQDGEQSNRIRLPANTFIGLATILQDFHHLVDIRSVSAFGQIMVDITSQLELTAGARWTDEERTHTQYNFNPANGPVGLMVPAVPKISASNVSPEVTLTYKPTETVTTFAAYRTGFKSGSFNTSSIQVAPRDASFDDEKAKGGEVGIKTLLADRTLAMSMSVYYYDYDDIQVGANEVSNLGGGNFTSVQRTLNAASATIKGVEFDASYSPAAIDGLTLIAAANYNRARYESFPNAPCGNNQTISQGCDQLLNPSTSRFTSQDLSGRRLVRAPNFTGYLGFDEKMSVASDLTLAFGAGANYVSDYSTNLVDPPGGFEQDNYVKVDAHLALRGRNDRWEVALIGLNLGDELTRAVCFNSNSQNGGILGGQLNGAATGGPAGSDEAGCNVERGREVWGRVSWRF